MKNQALILSAITILAALSCGSAESQPPAPAEVGSTAATTTPTGAPLPSRPPALQQALPTPTLTAVPTPSPTAIPSPTAQPTPTAQPLPSPQPSPVPIAELPKATPRPDQLPAAAWDLILGPARKHPPELNPGSEPLPPEKVTELWDTFLRGTRMHVLFVTTTGTRNDNVNLNFAFCEDGTGRLLITEELIDFSYTWTVQQSRGGLWNEAILEATTTRINDRPPRGSGQSVGGKGGGVLFISEDGPHYVDPLQPVTFSELGKCPA